MPKRQNISKAKEEIEPAWGFEEIAKKAKTAKSTKPKEDLDSCDSVWGFPVSYKPIENFNNMECFEELIQPPPAEIANVAVQEKSMYI